MIRRGEELGNILSRAAMKQKAMRRSPLNVRRLFPCLLWLLCSLRTTLLIHMFNPTTKPWNRKASLDRKKNIMGPKRARLCRILRMKRRRLEAVNVLILRGHPILCFVSSWKEEPKYANLPKWTKTELGEVTNNTHLQRLAAVERRNPRKPVCSVLVI